MQICLYANAKNECALYYQQGMDAEQYKFNRSVYRAINELNLISKAESGNHVISTLVNSQETYTFNHQKPSETNASMSYASNTISGDIGDTKNHTGLIAHELYHAYEHDQTNRKGRLVNMEVDADIFKAMVIQELFIGEHVSHLAEMPFGKNTKDGQNYQETMASLTDIIYNPQLQFNKSKYKTALSLFKQGSVNNATGIYNEFNIAPIPRSPLIQRFYHPQRSKHRMK